MFPTSVRIGLRLVDEGFATPGPSSTEALCRTFALGDSEHRAGVRSSMRWAGVRREQMGLSALQA
jgi:hypothetical protein